MRYGIGTSRHAQDYCKGRLLGMAILVWIVLLCVSWSGLLLADDSDVQVDSTMTTNSSTESHSFSATMTVGSNSNRYLAFGIALSADTTSANMPTVKTATWTVGSTVQSFALKQGQNSTTGSNDTVRAEIWELVAPTTGNGTITVTLDTDTISNETADSSPTGSTTVTGESLGTGDGATTTFSGTLSNSPVVRNTLTITAGSVTATDDGSGNLTGTGVSSGSINYDTGAWSITYSSAPSNGTSITADYDYGKWKFSGTLAHPKVDPSSVTFTATVGGSSKTATDDGSGSLSGDSGNISGTITYSTGAWTLEYMTPPDSSTNITATYDHQNEAQMVAGAMSFYNVNQTTPSPFGSSGSGESTNARITVDGNLRNVLFGTVATTGPASSLTKYYTGMTERWNHKNGSGNTDTYGAGATRPNTNDESAALRWTLGSSRKWASAGIDIQPPNTPTDAHFVRAEALATADGTLLRWKTACEVRNLGFRVYREDGAGERELLTASPVAGSALFAGPATRLSAGRSYVFWDRSATGPVPSRYWLEAIDLDGSSTWYGPFLSRPSDLVVPHGEATGQRTGMYPASSPRLAELSTAASTLSAATITGVRGRRGVGRTGAHRLQWIVAARPALKIPVTEDGWYSVTRAEMAAAGFDPGPDPVGIQVVAAGAEQAVHLTGTEDGRFDMDDAVEFYGHAVDLPYSGENIYWLRADTKPGRRIEVRDGSSGLAEPILSYRATVRRQDKITYVAAVTNNGNRDNFYGAVVSSEPVDQRLDVDRLATETGQAELEVALQAVTEGDHVVSVRLNGHALDDMTFSGFVHRVETYQVPESWLHEGENVVTLTAMGGDTDVSVVDSIALTWDRPLVARDGSLELGVRAGETIRIEGFPTDDIRLFDVTNPNLPVEIRGSIGDDGQGGFAVTARVPGEDEDRLLLAVAGASAPGRLIPNVPSAWNAAGNGAELVIITAPELRPAAEALAVYRNTHDTSAVVVDVTDIYDEMSFGIKSPEAIRAFLTRAYRSWEQPPAYAVLLGDASVDPRGYLGIGGADLVPTHIGATNFLKTASDSWFGDLDGDGHMEVVIGRLPAGSLDEANLMVSRITAYNAAEGDWTGRISLIADGSGGAFDFTRTMSELSQEIPQDYLLEQITVSEEDPGSARQSILQAFGHGRLVINFDGHGSQCVWTKSPDVFTADDALALTNGSATPLVVAMNCLNGFFHDVYQDSMAEALLRAPAGGAVAVWASSALTDPTGQEAMNRAFFQRLFDGSHPTLGTAVLAAQAGIVDRDILATWILFGDPSMRLH